ncbi:GH13 alpha-amylase precursor [Mycena capillaripes]|nr:GH13 alpha-amylase precursor [Mycena capillaripes]
MLLSFLALLSSLILVTPVFAASAADWSTKSIYQLVTDRFAMSNDSSTPCDTSLRTYCGGSWAGLTTHLDYIQEMGFDAVWISPIVANVDNTAYGDGYHGYWSRDIDTLNPRFGTSEDLKALSAALHTRGMYLMLDVVINHYAGIPTNTTSSSDFSFDFSTLQPFGTQADFHPQCFITDYMNQTDVEQCWLGDARLPLPDVDTEDPAVVATLTKWIRDTVEEYDVDGVRLDTVKHIRRDFWTGFSASAGVFTLGEVLTDDPPYAASYLGAVDGVFDYPKWYRLTAAFASPAGNLSALQASPALTSLAPGSAQTPFVTAAFLENHDQPRFPAYTADAALQRNALAWVFVGDGIPVLYYGQEQGYQGGADPSNREALWLSGYETTKLGVALVKALNAARKQAIAAGAGFVTTPARYLPQPDPHTLVLSKPPLLALLTNVGTPSTSTTSTANDSAVAWRIPPGVYAPGTVLVDVLACKTFIITAASGAAPVPAEGGMPRVLLPASVLSRAGGACPALASASGGIRGRGGAGARAVRALGAVWTVVGLGGLL